MKPYTNTLWNALRQNKNLLHLGEEFITEDQVRCENIAPAKSRSGRGDPWEIKTELFIILETEASK